MENDEAEMIPPAPLILSEAQDIDAAIAAINEFWNDVYREIEADRSFSDTVLKVLELLGRGLGADRAYTFSVTGNRTFSTCTNEWVRKPEYALKPVLKRVDQSGLKGWLDRFGECPFIGIEDIDNPPEDLREPAAKFKGDSIRSIYVYGFYDQGTLIGYLGVDYVSAPRRIDEQALATLAHLASVLNLYILRHETRGKELVLASMSHEIRNSLNAVVGLLDELRHNDVAETDRAAYLSDVDAAVKSLLALSNDALDISKIGTGNLLMKPVETSLTDILVECDGVFEEECRARGLELKLKVSSDMPHLVVDPVRLRQILFNLVGNAVKYTKAGGVSVIAVFRRETDRTGAFTLDVSDTGVGISEEDQKRVFALSERFAGTRGVSAASKGSGLGLTLCKLLAEHMDGEISVTSELGRGTTFRVEFRDMPYVAETRTQRILPNRIKSIAIPSRVLVVDDVPMNLKVLSVILKRLNIDAAFAATGEEALERLAEGGVSHVLADIWMPGMNGEELARRIRANPAWRGVKIAAQTADLEAGTSFDTSLFDALLPKPLTSERVFAFLMGAK